MRRKKPVSDRVARNVAQLVYDATVEATPHVSLITFYDFTQIVYQLIQQGYTPRLAHDLRRAGLRDAFVMIAALPRTHWSQRPFISNFEHEVDDDWRYVLRHIRRIHRRACEAASTRMETFLQTQLKNPARTASFDLDAYAALLRPSRRRFPRK